MAGKIPVRIEKIASADGEGSVEVFMDLDDFEATGASVRTDIREFKAAYLGAVEAARRADAPARAGGRVSARRRWAACRILADFNRAASNKFEIVNYKEGVRPGLRGAAAQRQGVPGLWRQLSDEEVLDGVPFSLYAELVFRNKRPEAGRAARRRKGAPRRDGQVGQASCARRVPPEPQGTARA